MKCINKDQKKILCFHKKNRYYCEEKANEDKSAYFCDEKFIGKNIYYNECEQKNANSLKKYEYKKCVPYENKNPIKWENKSCWIDSFFMALFYNPHEIVMNKIINKTEFKTNGEKEFHDLILSIFYNIHDNTNVKSCESISQLIKKFKLEENEILMDIKSHISNNKMNTQNTLLKITLFYPNAFLRKNVNSIDDEPNKLIIFQHKYKKGNNLQGNKITHKGITTEKIKTLQEKANIIFFIVYSNKHYYSFFRNKDNKWIQYNMSSISERTYEIEDIVNHITNLSNYIITMCYVIKLKKKCQIDKK